MDEASAAKTSRTEPADRPVPTQIADKYRVLRVLGHGATGTVYLCEHTALEKQVALKVLHRELADHAELVARFKQEAQTAARLDHPHSVHVMDFGVDRDGTLYLVMEYVEGRDLAELLADNAPLEDERIVHIMTSILSALSAAHALGIVHRDLKPENILFRYADRDSADLDVVKVCDFGVAQFSPIRIAQHNRATASQARRVTGDGMVVGTPWYMSPEQARAEVLDARSDVYSAGVVLFQLLTRTLPFPGDDIMAVAVSHCTTPPPAPSGHGPVHAGLEAVCLKALRKTREARYQSAAEMLSAVRSAFAADVPSRALARASTPPETRSTLPPVPADAAQALTVLATPAVRRAALRKVKPSWLVTGVAATLLALATAPHLLPSQHEPSTTLTASTDETPTAKERERSTPAQRPTQPMAAQTSDATSPPARPHEPPQPTNAPAEKQAEPELPEQAQHSPPLSLSMPLSARPREEAAPASTATKQPHRDSQTRDTRSITAPAMAAAEPASAALPAPQTTQATASEAGELGFEAGAKAMAAEPHRATAPALDALEAKTLTELIAAKAPATRAPTQSHSPAQAVPAPAATRKTVASINHVAIQTERVPSGTSRASLRNAINQSAIANCYLRTQRRQPQAHVQGTTLEIATNMSGRIVSAHVTNRALPQALRKCLEQVARAGRVRTGEGGEVQATLSLLPQP